MLVGGGGPYDPGMDTTLKAVGRGVLALAAVGIAAAGWGCGKEEPAEAWAIEKSSIVDEPRAKAPAPAREEPAPEAVEPAEGDEAAEEPEELTAARTSQSTFGRTRDRAREVRNEITGGATTEAPLAEMGMDPTLRAAGLVWALPEGWAQAIPVEGGVLAEAVVPHPLGNARLTVREDRQPAERALEAIGRRVLDEVGDPVRARPEAIEVAGLRVLRLGAEGTVLEASGRGGEQPFWAVRAAAVEREGRATVVVLLVGPEDTVRASEAVWEAMIEGMEQE